MKTPKLILSKGMSLLEITLVLGLTLALITALLFGIAAFQDGADRAKCIMNLVNMQKAMRSFMNLYEFRPEATFTMQDDMGNVIGGLKSPMKANIIGQGKFIDTDLYCPRTAGAGATTTTKYTEEFSTKFPKVGVMWMSCPNEPGWGHVPKNKANM